MICCLFISLSISHEISRDQKVNWAARTHTRIPSLRVRLWVNRSFVHLFAFVESSSARWNGPIDRSISGELNDLMSSERGGFVSSSNTPSERELTGAFERKAQPPLRNVAAQRNNRIITARSGVASAGSSTDRATVAVSRSLAHSLACSFARSRASSPLGELIL